MKTPEEIQPLCSNCQTPLNKIKGKYGTFWGCPNYLKCGFKGFSAKEKQPDSKPEVRLPTVPTRDIILLEEIQALSKRFDDFEAGFAEKMANLKKILIVIDGKLNQ